MPSWCTLYKGLITLVIILIAIEYFYGTIIETKRTNTVDKNIENIHSPILKLLTIASKRNSTYKSDKNGTEEQNLAHNGANITQSGNNNLINTSNAAGSPLIESSSSVKFETSTEHKIFVNSTNANGTEIPPCPDQPPDIDSFQRIKVVKSDPPTILELQLRFSWLKSGGHWYPENCKAKKVAIIAPYRCRAEHLLLFLQHMHPFLRKQQIDYTIYIIEQDDTAPFNRAMLMNVGFKEARKIDNYDCYIFHDIDLLPEDERNLYNCPIQPRHMSVAVDSLDYKLPYKGIFGGVTALTKEHFEVLNGFSNSFWGWGGEDDDMSNRITYHNLHISRYPISIARFDILKEGRNKFDSDGLNSLQYKVLKMKKHLLYTWILTDVRPHS